MKTKSIKARKTRPTNPPITASLETIPARHTWMPGDDESRKQWVIYAGDKPKEAYSQMVEQMAKGLAGNLYPNIEKAWADMRPDDALNQDSWREYARAALSAIGIKEPKT